MGTGDEAGDSLDRSAAGALTAVGTSTGRLGAARMGAFRITGCGTAMGAAAMGPAFASRATGSATASVRCNGRETAGAGLFAGAESGATAAGAVGERASL